MNVFLTLLTVAAAAWAHGFFPALRRAGFRLALRLFAVGSLAAAAALALASRGALTPVRPTLLALAAAGGLVGWTGLIRLVSFESHKRDTIWRFVCIFFMAVVLMSSGSAGGTAFFAMLGTLAWRWKRELHTRSRFTIGLFALVLGMMLVIHTGHVWIPNALPAMQEKFANYARAMLIATSWYALLGSVALLRAWAQDPSLGIRRVAHRLTLSHILVGLVPVLLLGALWTATTVLGVLNERAIVGSRAIAAQGRWYRTLLATSIERPEVAAQRLASLPAAMNSRADVELWYRADSAFVRLSGRVPIPASRLNGWIAGLDSLPRSGMVRMTDSLYLGATAAGPRGTAAVMLVPIGVALADLPDSVTRSTLRVLNSTFTHKTRPTSFVNDDDDSSAAAVRELQSARTAPRDQRALRTRRALERLGVPDSAITTDGRIERPGHVNLSIGGQSLNLDEGADQFLLQGHSLAAGIDWTAHGWERASFMLTAAEPPGDVLSGLFRDARTSELGLIPPILVGLFALLALLVVAWDLMMVSGMGGSITQAVTALDEAAARLRAGDLSHRIPIQGEDDLWQVAEAFNAATDGLVRAREAEKERARIEGELDVARRIQSRLLPAAPPHVNGLEVAGHYDPAREVGGDYYDHIALDDHRVLLAIADVSGKSVPAALIMAGFRAALVSQDLVTGDPPVLAERLNGFLNDSLDPGKFVTAFLADVDGLSGRVTYVNCGHNPPVLLRADGRHEMLEAGGTILGIMPGSRYERGNTTLDPGDVLLLYTDGVPEGTAPSDELWGDERLVDALQRHAAESCAQLVLSIAGEVRAFEAERGPADDVTLIAVRRAHAG